MQTVLMNPYRIQPVSLTPASIDVRVANHAWGRVGNTSSYNDNDAVHYLACDPSDALWNQFVFVVNIPQGAVIDDARLTLYASNNTDWSAAPNIDVGAEQVDDATFWTSGTQANNNLTNVSTEIVWNPTGGIGTVTSGNPIAGADLSSVLQQIVDRAGWVSGNNLALISNGPTTGGCYSYRGRGDANSAYYPRLEVDYRA